MAKKQTSKKQKASLAKAPVFVKLKPNIKTSAWTPTAEILDVDSIKDTLIQALIEGDAEAFKEILTAHLEAKVKTKAAKEFGLSERTMYEALSEKGNPSLSTLTKIVQMAFAS